jgi:AraC family transcriptional regulator, ethanolamine operon transcriptional activator
VSPAHHATPAFRHLIHRLSDPAQFGVAVSGASLNADFLAPQKLPARIEQFQAPGWALDFQEAHVKARILGPLPPGWVSLGLIRGPAPSSWYGLDGGSGMLLCNPPGEPIDGCITPGFECLTVNVPVAAWEKCRAISGVEPSVFAGFKALQMPPPHYARMELKLRALRRLLRRALSEPNLFDLGARAAADFATDVATTAWELGATAVPPRDSLRNRTRLARRAEEWMRANIAESVRIPDVCLALRVSRRELEYSFRTAFDQSPRDFLQTLRLNAIRRALRRSGSVSRAAFDHGITHPSRFAADYRALFGEMPSETHHRRPHFA